MTYQELIVKYGADIAPAVAGIEKLNAKIASSSADISSRFGALASKLQGIGIAMSMAITAPLVMIAKSASDAYVEMDGLKKGLTAVTGSAEAMNAQMKEIKEIAKLPGLGIKEAAQGAINLQAAGIEAGVAMKALMGFGNALATVGKGKVELDGVILALTQISSKGKVSAEEINQIAERVPQIRKIMEKAFGTSNTEVLQKMKMTSQEFISGIVDELDKLPKVTGGIRNSLENMSDAIYEAKVAFGSILAPTVSEMSAKLSVLAKWFTNLSPPVKKAIIVIAGLAAAIGPALLLVAQLIPAIAALPGLIAAFSSGGALAGVGAAIAGLATPIGWIVAGITALIIAYKTNFAGFRDFVIDIKNTVVEFVTSIWKEIKPILPQIKAIWKAMNVFAKNQIEVLKALLKGIGLAFKAVIAVLTALITRDWTKCWKTLKEVAQKAADAISNLFVGIQLNFAEALKSIYEVLHIDTSGIDAVIDRLEALRAAYEGTNAAAANSPGLASGRVPGKDLGNIPYIPPAKDPGKTVLGNALDIAIAAIQAAIENMNNEIGAYFDRWVTYYQTYGMEPQAKHVQAYKDYLLQLAALRQLEIAGWDVSQRKTLALEQYWQKIFEAYRKQPEEDHSKELAQQIANRVRLVRDEAKKKIQAWNEWVQHRKKSETGFTSLEQMSRRTAESGLGSRYDRMLLTVPKDTPVTNQEIVDAIYSLSNEKTSDENYLKQILGVLNQIRGNKYAY